ncbi:MAG: hypothetical protein J1F03_06740 [Oscillospiraceae bacterium]|nr:hypothetical protein [Oscillospiraceae bacterium]
MKRTNLRSKTGKNRTASRCLALLLVMSFVALALPGYDVLPKAVAANNTAAPLAVPENNSNLLAHFEFESGLDDSSENSVQADLMDANGGIIDSSGYIKSDGSNKYLDLNGQDVYLSLSKNGSGVLDNMAEVTVEMRLKIMTAGGNQWPFYAAPNAYTPTVDNNEHYLSVHLNNDCTIFTRRYGDLRRPVGTPNSGGLSAPTPLEENAWYTVKVVYEAGKTTLSVKKDGEEEEAVSAADLSVNVWDCVGENGILWFGHSAWGQFFNGCIDDIKIWGVSRDDISENAAAVENDHIIYEKVIDPANTTVNMFDYWVFEGQNDKDYDWVYGKTVSNLIDNGINKDHLFLFDGSASFEGGDSDELGVWNNYGRAPFLQGESKWGIVQRTLYNGYPRLALNDSAWTVPSNTKLSGLWTDEKRTESLDYLFNLAYHDGKKSYPNVTGLFRINDAGYYYFRSQDVFAELNAEQAYDPTQPKTSTNNNHITLYDTPWREEYARGQFFPFNDWTDLFYEINGNVGQKGDQGHQALPGNQPMNHWFGMTIETEFMQPTGGTLYNGDAMTFEFSGDDDVWIFIDDVLVADVGGVHNRIRVKIDYSTGKIVYERELEYDGMKGKSFTDSRGETTLLDMFKAAGKEGITEWNGNTFGNNTIHTLKFFYLERGNAASNCNISFNLQEPIVDRIRKVNQNGDPLEGATFELYKAEPKAGIRSEWWKHTADDFNKIGNPITTTISNYSGYAALTKANGEPLDLEQSDYYILRETKTPEGYRKNPDIVLQYHRTTETLTVVNKYEVGAYASFLADWKSRLDICFADYSAGTFSKDSLVNGSDLIDGLAIVVPVLKSRDTSDESPVWLPMYGSNTLGWNIVTPSGNSKNDLIKALAEAALMQIADPRPQTQDWYLRWDGTRLKGQMENLPGDATRYVFNSGSDGDLVTLFLSGDALRKLGLNGSYANDDERYTALSNELAGKDAKALAAGLSNLEILYTGDFDKAGRTVIYVPNEQHELRVRKVDDKNKPIAGAVFALFDNLDNAVNATTTTSAGVKAFGTTGSNGELIFRASGLTNSEAGYGYAKMNWEAENNTSTIYWLKEITAPKGYELNESLIRVEVGSTGIYANATGFDHDGNLLKGDDAENDGIKVEASLGRLTQTLVKYAEGIVDETLKHITAVKQTANGTASWVDGESKTLTYKAEGYDPVTFTAENGYIRVMPRQTAGITAPTAKRDDLSNIDLDGLFSLINTVVVADTPIPGTGSLTVTKTVKSSEGGEINDETDFSFIVTLSDKTFNYTYRFTGDKIIKFENGAARFTLRHGESVTFTGLPEGVTYTVTEADAEGYTVTSTGSTGTIVSNGNVEAAFINTKINEPDKPEEPSYPNKPDDPYEPDEPDKPNGPDKSDDSNASNDNPNTGFDARLGFWSVIVTLSLIVAVNRIRKRCKHQK